MSVAIQRAAAGCSDFSDGIASRPRRGVGSVLTSALETEQEIHGRLIGGWKPIRLEFSRFHPAAVRNPGRFWFGGLRYGGLVKRQVDRIAVVVMGPPRDTRADFDIDSDPLPNLTFQRVGFRLALFHLAAGEFPQAPQHRGGATLGDEVTILAWNDRGDDPHVTCSHDPQS